MSPSATITSPASNWLQEKPDVKRFRRSRRQPFWLGLTRGDGGVRSDGRRSFRARPAAPPQINNSENTESHQKVAEMAMSEFDEAISATF